MQHGFGLSPVLELEPEGNIGNHSPGVAGDEIWPGQIRPYGPPVALSLVKSSDATLVRSSF